jgi:hypothetical protein
MRDVNIECDKSDAYMGRIYPSQDKPTDLVEVIGPTTSLLISSAESNSPLVGLLIIQHWACDDPFERPRKKDEFQLYSNFKLKLELYTTF